MYQLVVIIPILAFIAIGIFVFIGRNKHEKNCIACKCGCNCCANLEGCCGQCNEACEQCQKLKTTKGVKVIFPEIAPIFDRPQGFQGNQGTPKKVVNIVPIDAPQGNQGGPKN